MKKKQIQALEQMIVELQNEIDYIKNGSVVYTENIELIDYVSENILVELKENLNE